MIIYLLITWLTETVTIIPLYCTEVKKGGKNRER